jgi:hypothetical protein
MTMGRKGGRPTRVQARTKAMAALLKEGADLADFDPRLILRAIAADPSAPAVARVSACRCLLACEKDTGDEAGSNSAAMSKASRRAIELLSSGTIGRAN